MAIITIEKKHFALQREAIDSQLLRNYLYTIAIPIPIIKSGVMITANYNYQLQLPQHYCLYSDHYEL